MDFGLFLQNNGNRQVTAYKCTGSVPNPLSFKLDFEEKLDKGEYTYACFIIRRDVDNVILHPSIDFWNSTVETQEGTVPISALKPFVGLLRVGSQQKMDIITDCNTDSYIYYDEE